jgi:flagellin-like hook-associated protein FlgL
MRIGNFSSCSSAELAHLRAASAVQKSIGRLSSGSQITETSDDAGGVAVSVKMRAAIKRADVAVANLLNADAFLSAQDGALDGIGKGITRMMELKTLSQDPTKNATDIQNYSTEFDEIREHLAILSKSKLNGVDLFSHTGTDTYLEATADENGQQTVTLTQYALGISLGEWLSDEITFSFVTGLVTWDQAREDAERRGGRLATITSAEKWNVAALKLGPDRDRTMWLGGWRERLPDGTLSAWQWLSGEAFDFEYWHSGEPRSMDIGANGRAYIMANHPAWSDGVPNNGDWNDGQINHFVDGYLLEKPAKPKDFLTIQGETLSSKLQLIANCRANNGAESMCVEMSVEKLRSKSTNLEAANSRIADVDVADETHHLNKARILAEASSAMIKQARSANEVVLRLLNL